MLDHEKTPNDDAFEILSVMRTSELGTQDEIA